MVKRKGKKGGRKRSYLPSIAIIAVLIVVVLSVGYRQYIILDHPLRYYDIIERYAEKYGLPPSLILAVIKTESRFNEDAVSKKGASGLMQITDSTFNWISSKLPKDDQEKIEDIFDPEVNIKYGSFLLSHLYSEFKSWPETFAAYNAGRTKVNSWLESSDKSDNGETLRMIPYKETREYIVKVQKAKERYETLYPQTAGKG